MQGRSIEVEECKDADEGTEGCKIAVLRWMELVIQVNGHVHGKVCD